MKKRPTLLRKLLTGLGVFLITVLFVVILSYLYIAYFLPLPDALTIRPHHLSTKIYDRHGALLYEVLSPGQGRKTYLALSEMPPEFLQAVIASEDSDFYHHIGIDPGAIARAFFYNSLEQRITSGASTITQQLVRNLLGTNRSRTFVEKIEETVYAIRLSNLYSKDQVLEQYLNTVYFGNQAYGAGEAALRYYNKNLSDLDLAELTMLAGLPQSPSKYNPIVNLSAAKKRQQYVLDRLVQLGQINTQEAQQAGAESLKFATAKVKIEAPHFVQYLLAQLEATYGEDLLYSGLEIRTTIDLDLEKKAEQIINYQLGKISDKHVTDAALLSADVRTGEILVWVGSKDYFDDQIAGQVDIITSERQPGSALKPFLYLLALQSGDTPATIVEDLPLQVKTDSGIYSPLNYDLDFHGPVRLREALANSFNIPAVRTQQKIGTEKFLNFLRQLGLKTLNQKPDYYGLSLTLGGGEVRLYDLANAYLTLANLGEQREFTTILEIKNANTGEIIQQSPSASHNIFGSWGQQNAALIIDILSDPNARLKSFGQGNVLELPFPAAAKTGTTRNFKDNWTFGFSNQLLTAVWVGNADATAMEKVSGIDGAGPIWHDFMNFYHLDPTLRRKVDLGFKMPAGLQQIEICAISGLLPTPNCQQKLLEWFRSGTEPLKTDNFWQKVTCPGETPKVQIVFPEPYLKWADDRDLNPSEDCQFSSNYSQEGQSNGLFKPEIMINSPLPGDAYQIDHNLPIESQKIPIRVLAKWPQGSAISQISVLVDDQVVKTQSVSQSEASMQILEKWLPNAGQHRLKVDLYSADRQKTLSNEVNFSVQ